MARKKSDDKTTAAINFRCSVELKRKLEILQFATQAESISELIIRLCENVIEENSELIERLENARQSSPFKFPAKQIDSVVVGDDDDAEN